MLRSAAGGSDSVLPELAPVWWSSQGNVLSARVQVFPKAGEGMLGRVEMVTLCLLKTCFWGQTGDFSVNFCYPRGQIKLHASREFIS